MPKPPVTPARAIMARFYHGPSRHSLVYAPVVHSAVVQFAIVHAAIVDATVTCVQARAAGTRAPLAWAALRSSSGAAVCFLPHPLQMFKNAVYTPS